MLRLAAFLFAVLPFFSHSSINVNGSFTATKACPAYLSKNKKTNPDNLNTEPGQLYSLREINQPFKPKWLRISIPGAQSSKLRWVAADCGEYGFSYQPNFKGVCEQNPGLADSHVLALSWQPAFCQSYGYEAGKPECLHLPAKSYQATHLVLHGLWPNQHSCGQRYGFCGVNPQVSHCAYPPIILSEPVANNLRQLMPSFAYGSCLERHEWNKHGSCQLLSEDEYFSLAMRLNREANQTALALFLAENLGETVERAELRKLIRQSFGKDTSSKVYLGCKNGFLVDIYIQLPALIPQNESLASLINKAPDFQRPDACPAKIVISDFNSESWF